MNNSFQMSERDWRKKLSPEQYKVLREKGTENPFAGEYVNEKRPGTYVCSGCGQELFSSADKYDSGTGWPSFYDVLSQGSVVLRKDTDLGMTRVEVVCSRCGSHLGHLFDDGPLDLPDGRRGTGKRYCINSCALKLQPRGVAAQ